MIKKSRLALLILACSAAGLFAAVTPHIGFVYPAGANPGETMTVTIGGQFLKDFSGLYLSGEPLKAVLTDYLRIYDRQEAGRIKRMKDTLEQKIAEETSKTVKEQMQRQIDQAEQEMTMVAEMRREDKMDPALAAKKQFNPQIAERITLQFTLPAQTKPGEYELRVMTTNGLSNPLLFQIGRIPEISEKEPNNQVNKAVDLPDLPVMVNGQIMPGDVDCFRFSAKAGQTMVLRAEARALVPYLADAVPGWFQAVLTLYDAQGNEVAYDDDFRFDPDPVLIYTISADGHYTFSIRDSIFRGREDFVYRISVGETPFIKQIFPLGGTEGREIDVHLSGVNLPVEQMKLKTGYSAGSRQIRVEKDGLASNTRLFSVSPLPDGPEVEPNDSVSSAQSVKPGTIINGIIGISGDQDWFCFKGQKDKNITVEVSARRLGSPLDTRLILLNEKQEMLASNDDTEDKSTGLITHHADSRIDFTPPANGIYFVRLDDLQGKGGDDYAYRLMIHEEQPDFQLRIIPSGLCIPRDGAAIATVHAIRTGGFTGEIQLSAPNAPSGIVIERAVIPEGIDSARIMIAAKFRTEEQLIPLEIEGSADCGSRTLTRRAVPAEDMMQAFLYRHWVAAQQLLIRVGEPEQVNVSLDIPNDGVFRARPDSEIVISATVKYRDRSVRNIKLTLAEPPEWLTLKNGYLSGRGGRVILAISPDAEPGDTATVLLNGNIRIPKSPDDPDYNPVMKYLNFTSIDFTIDAVSIQVIN